MASVRDTVVSEYKVGLSLYFHIKFGRFENGSLAFLWHTYIPVKQDLLGRIQFFFFKGSFSPSKNCISYMVLEQQQAYPTGWDSMCAFIPGTKLAYITLAGNARLSPSAAWLLEIPSLVACVSFSVVQGTWAPIHHDSSAIGVKHLPVLFRETKPRLLVEQSRIRPAKEHRKSPEDSVYSAEREVKSLTASSLRYTA